MPEDNNTNDNNDLLTHIRALPLVSDLKFRRFFSDTTPQTRHIMEVFLSHALKEKVKVKKSSPRSMSIVATGRRGSQMWTLRWEMAGMPWWRCRSGTAK